jgi:hypothetical protein
VGWWWWWWGWGWEVDLGSAPCTVHCAVLIGTISRKMVLLAALSNGQNPLGMSNTGAMKQLRGPKHENWPGCDPRAVPPGEYGLKSGENGHLARPNGAVDGPYCSPTCPSVCVRRCEPLAGAVVLRAELHQRPHAARGALLQFDWLRKKLAMPRPWGTVPEGLGGMAELRRLFPGGPGGAKQRPCHNSQALSNA